MSDILNALQSRKNALSDRVHFITVELRNVSTTKYTEADLQSAQKDLEETIAALAAVKLYRKCVPISELKFNKIIKVKDLREALSHPDDQNKCLWTFDEQSATYDNVVGITQSEYNGKPTINLLINVIDG